ncbi:MAG: polyprenol monophosphomannose synthase [Candidatus Competibacteraceae bacterium]|nr:polyprenol monophosphomannose synthase [Candidatus Competibacteraceae bacterium]
MSDSIVIIPTYNEIENIEKMIHTVMNLPYAFDVLIVDDGSPDGTAAVVKKYQNIYPNRLFILERKEKNGLGTAYIAGFRWVLNRNYTYCFEMDCDFSHNPTDLIRLRACCAEDHADLAIGSRYVNGVNVVNWPMSRVLLSYFASKYVRFITGMKIHDATAGFKCYRTSLLAGINFDNIRFKGYAFQIEMKYIAYKMGFSLKEVSIIFTDRQEGTSKISGNIVWEAIFGVIRLRFSSIRKYKMRP